MVLLPLDTAPVRAFLDDKHVTLAERVREFATRVLAPLAEPTDDAAARQQARELLGTLGAAGWFQPIRDQDWRACCIMREALAAASPLADAVFALQALGVVPMLLSANDAMRRRWLDPAIQGRAMASFAMTEPDAGSDVASLGATAEPDGDAYVISGTKTFISNAGIADFYTVFATTDRAKKDKGIACFVVPADTAGVRLVRPLVLSSPHPLGEIAFQKARVPSECRLDGASAGGGFKLGLATLDRVRATVGAAACGMASRALAEALAHAKSRRQFGKPLADFQLIQEKLARMATDLTAARLLVYRAAWEKDRGAPRVTLEAAMAKAFATEAAQRIVDDAVQILGARGVLADNPVERLYRAVRALRIYEGTTEIQHLIIAGQLVK
jgi:acyl-CoA dehydrogenase